MADAANDVVNMPPLPPLQWDGYFWSAPVVLNAWAGFQSRDGDYGAQTTTELSNGSAMLVVESADEDVTPPLPEQAAAYGYLLEHQEQLCGAILQAVFDAYPAWREKYDYDADVAAEVMPMISQPDDLKALIGLSEIHIYNGVEDDMAYIGYSFGCSWDEEHGLDVMMHGDRIVELDGEEMSSDDE